MVYPVTDELPKRLQERFSRYHDNPGPQTAKSLVKDIYDLKKLVAQLSRAAVAELAAGGVLRFGDYRLSELLAALEKRQAAFEEAPGRPTALALIAAAQPLETVAEEVYSAAWRLHDGEQHLKEFTSEGWKPVDQGGRKGGSD